MTGPREVVLGDWCRITPLQDGYWLANVAGVTVHVRVTEDGQARNVMVRGPEDAGVVPGCRYELVWVQNRDGGAS
jgi:hypothetical protein